MPYIRREEIECFLRFHGLWEGIVHLPRSLPPPSWAGVAQRSLLGTDIMEPIEPPWQAIKEWIPDDEPDLDRFNRPRKPSNPDPDWRSGHRLFHRS